ncbi:NmrA family transcriptional regulator [Streptomyces spiramenti]|uniref:NmrA family transcriptional regulator n=1 Tax=Streptomyces spiramenti TaxID=2720606 RepID=UPI001FD7E324|nr:NmrA family transcriptional regulator [Streptomyces spiramenti]
MNNDADNGAATGGGPGRRRGGHLTDCALLGPGGGAPAGRDGTTDTGPDVLVLGGTGKTGRRVAGRLRAMRLRVRVGSRAAATAPFDWQDPAGWPAVLAGARAVYAAYAPDLSDPAAPERLGALARAAATAGAERLVVLSGRGMSSAARAEESVVAALAGTGTGWTMLRGCWFAQNFSEDFLLPEVLRGTVSLPAGEVAEPFVDLADLADAAVAALTGPGHAGQVYTLTGPRALTFREAVAEIGWAAGREVRYRPMSRSAYLSEMVARGASRAEASAAMGTLRETLDGSCSDPADGVLRAVGRPPRDFSEYVRRTAASGVWDEE